MSAYRRTYKHALPVSEAIERIFEYQIQHDSLSEILQLSVEQSERDYREALVDPDRQAEIADLKKQLESDQHERDLAREMSIELNTAADNLMAGDTHKYLVLSKRDHYGLQPHFTKDSLYAWAKECHGKVIPEWAPPVQQMPKLSVETEYTPDTSDKGCIETLYIIAAALGRMINKLVEDEHITHPTGKRCIDDDDTEDLLAIAEYLAISPPVSGTAVSQGESLQNKRLTEIAEPASLALGAVAYRFCQLAEQARMEKWISFLDQNNEKMRNPFHRERKYSSSHIYKYLIKLKAIKTDTTNQRKSAILHRLGDAQKLLAEKGLPAFSAVQFRELLVIGQQLVRKRRADEEAAKKGKRTLSPHGG